MEHEEKTLCLRNLNRTTILLFIYIPFNTPCCHKSVRYVEPNATCPFPELCAQLRPSKRDGKYFNDIARIWYARACTEKDWARRSGCAQMRKLRFLSAQVRRASAKCLEAIVSTRPELLVEFYQTVSLPLIARFKVSAALQKRCFCICEMFISRCSALIGQRVAIELLFSPPC